jgi:hypothetical protein
MHLKGKCISGSMSTLSSMNVGKFGCYVIHMVLVIYGKFFIIIIFTILPRKFGN